MRFGGALPTIAVLVLAGCSSAAKPHASDPCAEGKPLACEQQQEHEGGFYVTAKAQKRLTEGKAPHVNGEDSEERLKRAEEEVRAGAP